jgi:predicted secreted protein
MTTIRLARITSVGLTLLILSASMLMAADAAITVTQEQAGRELTLKKGDILQIELPGTGGTGYSWSVEAAGGPYLKLMSQDTKLVGGPRPGSPVMQIWRFKAERPGAAEIKMAYYRPWEGKEKAVEHFHLKLRID